MWVSNSRRTPIVAVTLLSLFVALRFLYPEVLDSIHDYASYLFEVAFVAATLALLPNREKERAISSRRPTWGFLVTATAGFGVFRIAGTLGLAMPFDLGSPLTLLMLLLIGPVLEEFLFRGAIWRLLQGLRSPTKVAWLTTSVLFSLSHFMAWFRVPEEWHPFILYQTAYTLMLGLYCGSLREKTGSLAAPTVVHLVFNLGFYLGSLS